MKLNEKAAQSFARLRGSPDFAVVLEWLKGHRTALRDTCCTAEGETLYRAQGKVKAVDDFIAAYTDAPKALEKFSQQQ